MRLPNQDRFVSSGDVVSTHGVGGADSSATAKNKIEMYFERYHVPNI